MCFAHFEFKSTAVNRIAVSAFASVLTHGYAMNNVYIPLIQDLYKASPFVTFLCEAVGIMLAYLIISVVLDKPRIYLWEKYTPSLIDGSYHVLDNREIPTRLTHILHDRSYIFH